MQNFGLMLAVFTIWGIADYFNSRLIFDKFHRICSGEGRDYHYGWLIYCVLAVYAYGIFRHMVFPETQSIVWKFIYVMLYLMYYLRMVPFLWSKYGVSTRIPVVYFFYELVSSALSSNIAIIVSEFYTLHLEKHLLSDLMECVAALLVCGLLTILYLYKHSKKINIWFASLATWEYILIILSLFLMGNLETIVFRETDLSNVQGPLKVMTMLSMFFILFLMMRVILVKERNTSMEVVIHVLKEQMGQLTGYYSELNRKDNELRKFRHDVKNMLLVLQSMVEDGKSAQALDYMKQMGAMYQKTAKLYDTGNFIADALLSTKAQMAADRHTRIIMNGRIPTESVEDVDMVILLSNLLDNALEACAQVDGEKEIVINSALSESLWCIEVCNPVRKDVVIHGNHIETSKEHKETHGFGLLNIERTAKQYDGMLKLSCERQIFTAKVTLKLEPM